MGLHSTSRKKVKIAIEDLHQKIEKKIAEIKLKTVIPKKEEIKENIENQNKTKEIQFTKQITKIESLQNLNQIDNDRQFERQANQCIANWMGNEITQFNYLSLMMGAGMNSFTPYSFFYQNIQDPRFF